MAKKKAVKKKRVTKKTERKKVKKLPAKPQRTPNKYDPLMQVVVDCTAFFEMCDDDTLDPDIACKYLEWITHNLRQLGPNEIRELTEFVNHAADEAVADSETPERIEFLQTFIENCNLEAE